MCLLPWAHVEQLGADPSGLYEVLWRQEWEAGRLDLVVVDTPFLDCGTPADYLRANLFEAARSDTGSLVDPAAVMASGSSVTRSVVGAGAEVRGDVADAVVWPGSVVHPGEQLRGGIRAGRLTVLVR
jgi:mannose-1-phosphate guanylyltransferase/MurNAc alpha-1-phosphate uridylyltransferase